MYERGYSDFFESLFEIVQYLITKGHNTEFRDPYNYSIRHLIKLAQTTSKIEDRHRSMDAQIQLTTNIASGGFGGKEAGKHFKEMIEKLNGE